MVEYETKGVCSGKIPFAIQNSMVKDVLQTPERDKGSDIEVISEPFISRIEVPSVVLTVGWSSLSLPALI